jgi:putative transposase
LWDQITASTGSVRPLVSAWKTKFGGLEVSEARRLRSLEDENAKLKRMLADAMLDNLALKDLLAKKW